MLNEILAFWTPGPLELIIIYITFFFIFVIPAALIIFLVIYLVQNNKEKQRLRTEMEKLAEQVRQLLQEQNSK